MKKTMLLFVSMLSLNTNCRELPSYSELLNLLLLKTTSINNGSRRLPSYPDLLDLLLLKTTPMRRFLSNDMNRAGLIWDRPVVISPELIEECPERIGQIEKEYAMIADSETPPMIHPSVITHELKKALDNFTLLAYKK